MFYIHVLEVLHLFERVALVVILHTEQFNSEQFVVKASKFLCNFTFLITLCQQFFKHFNIYNSLVEFFYLNI